VILLITCLELPLTELVRRLITLNAEHTVIVLLNAKKVIEILGPHFLSFKVLNCFYDFSIRFVNKK
jgi:hypothetical protein